METPDVSKFNKACTAVTEYCDEGRANFNAQAKLVKVQQMLADAELTAKGLPSP